MPRTTIDIDGPVFDEMRRLQRKEGTTLGSLASSLLGEALAARRKQPAVSPRLRWVSRPMGAQVRLDDKDAVWAVLDGKKERRRG